MLPKSINNIEMPMPVKKLSINPRRGKELI